MAETKIEWADFTFNPWIGCTKVSDACLNCYAEALMDHRHHRVEWGGERSLTSDANWRLPYRWNEAARKAGERRRVFTLSLGDFFDNQVPDDWRHWAWEVIAQCQNLDWLILTKRPQNIAKMLPASCAVQLAGMDWPWPHVWLGCTAENQEEADRRIPALLAVPAAQHFISVEPMLGPINLSGGGRLKDGRLRGGHYWLTERPCPVCSMGGDPAQYSHPINCGWRHDQGLEGSGIDLVICGGESGPNARPMHPDWPRSLRDQCQAAGTAYFFKQWGDWLPGQNDPHPSQKWGIAHWQDGGWGTRKTRNPHDNYIMWEADGTPHQGERRAGEGYFTVSAWASRVGKRAAGRLLDESEWSEMPRPR